MSELLEAAAQRRRRILAAMAELDDAARPLQPACEDEPVFVCGVGWRCGSTLVQRMLMTDPRMLVWGEPMHRMGVLSHLTEIVAGASQDWPPRWHYASHAPPSDLAREWVANLAPDPGDLKAGLLAMVDGWLGAPARRRGFTRWGVKEVRWSGDEVEILRWLYPKSRILIVVRHPVLAYRSLSRLGFGTDDPAGGWWIRWPERIVDLDSFGRYWNELALSWATAGLEATVIRYEELAAGAVDVRQLGGRLGLDLDPAAALDVRVGATPIDPPLTADERDRINALTVEGRRFFLYGE